MKMGFVMFVLSAAALVLFSTGSAEAAMYVDSEERRTATFSTFVLVTGLISALCVLITVLARNSKVIEESQQSSVVVPPIKQESNIVQHLVTA